MERVETIKKEKGILGIPGIIIQLLCVPIIAKVMNERLNLKND